MSPDLGEVTLRRRCSLGSSSMPPFGPTRAGCSRAFLPGLHPPFCYGGVTAAGTLVGVAPGLAVSEALPRLVAMGMLVGGASPCVNTVDGDPENGCSGCL